MPAAKGHLGDTPFRQSASALLLNMQLSLLSCRQDAIGIFRRRTVPGFEIASKAVKVLAIETVRHHNDRRSEPG